MVIDIKVVGPIISNMVQVSTNMAMGRLTMDYGQTMSERAKENIITRMVTTIRAIGVMESGKDMAYLKTK